MWYTKKWCGGSLPLGIKLRLPVWDHKLCPYFALWAPVAVCGQPQHQTQCIWPATVYLATVYTGNSVHWPAQCMWPATAPSPVYLASHSVFGHSEHWPQCIWPQCIWPAAAPCPMHMASHSTNPSVSGQPQSIWPVYPATMYTGHSTKPNAYGQLRHQAHCIWPATV